ncbi:MAG TPA: zinc-ribbon domain-containing protein [Nitrososphaera sp.]|nr:zinc-ribbon domain-containing protein [Nitrososphaera sp.]
MYLQENGFEVAFSKDPTEPASWFFIQARKASALRTVAGARRSTDITINGSPGNFEVSIGTGEWGKNLVTSAPLFIVPVVGISATLVKLYTAKKFEDNLWKYIKDQSRFLADSALRASDESSSGNPSGAAASVKKIDTRTYDCDYVEGYPGWDEQVLGGKLLLVREKGGKNRLAFQSPDSKEIAISSANVIEAHIIARKKGLNEDDLMIQMICKDASSGKTIKPVFNLNDDIIRGVLAGINELVGEDKVLRSFEQVNVTTETKHCESCGVQIPKEAKFCSSCGTKQ